ncbi:MAG: putative viral replication protein [Kreonivirus seabatis]|uniref:Putative viral replication protein n=1 Tax=Circoviridae sp. TaxID=1954248 RepID=A0A385E1P4_9VIRU|nr:MAG: putative viral replication protein [Circoviridae sp.]
MSPQSQRWCFTVNNYTDEYEVFICQLLCGPDVTYGVYGREVGTEGTRHLQGFLILRDRHRLGGVREFFGDIHPHLEPARGSSPQASNYCKKDGDFEEFGTCPNPGKRTEFDELKTWVLDHPHKPTAFQIAREFPQLFLKYGRIMEWVEAIYPTPSLEEGNPHQWQRNLARDLEAEADDRQVIFVVDEQGGAGKSWFSRWWYTAHADLTQLLGVGKRDDLAHAIEPDKRYFLFDVPRTQLEFFQYSILEQLKNRIVFSPKYSSRVKVLNHVPHVVVFCNESPDMNKLTSDRYKVINIRNI